MRFLTAGPHGGAQSQVPVRYIDPSFIISHRSTNLEDGPALYETFRDKKDNCTKVVFKPHG